MTMKAAADTVKMAGAMAVKDKTDRKTAENGSNFNETEDVGMRAYLCGGAFKSYVNMV